MTTLLLPPQHTGACTSLLGVLLMAQRQAHRLPPPPALTPSARGRGLMALRISPVEQYCRSAAAAELVDTSQCVFNRSNPLFVCVSNRPQPVHRENMHAWLYVRADTLVSLVIRCLLCAYVLCASVCVACVRTMCSRPVCVVGNLYGV